MDIHFPKQMISFKLCTSRLSENPEKLPLGFARLPNLAISRNFLLCFNLDLAIRAAIRSVSFLSDGPLGKNNFSYLTPSPSKFSRLGTSYQPHLQQVMVLSRVKMQFSIWVFLNRQKLIFVVS